MTKFFKIVDTRRNTFIWVKGEFVPQGQTLRNFVKGVRWIKKNRKWSGNCYCFAGRDDYSIIEITEEQVGA